jgi:hypothetical protein
MDSLPESKEGYPKMILFGDSLTERSFNVENRGFGAVLQNYYARRVDVVNRGQYLVRQNIPFKGKRNAYKKVGIR